MKKKLLKTLTAMFFLAASAFMFTSQALAYNSHYGPTELTYYDAAKSAGGYTLFTPFGNSITYLMDMQGNVVKTWPCPEGWAIEKFAEFLPNGNLLRRIKLAQNPEHLQEVDWDNNVVVDIVDTREEYTHHHDFVKIFNKKLGEYTYLSVATKTVTWAETEQAGADPSLPNHLSKRDSKPDGIVEFDKYGNIIWEWKIFDHLVQDFDASKDNYGIVAESPGKLDINYGMGRSGDWIHINSLDYNPTLGHIVVNNSKDSEVYIIDHDGTFFADKPEQSITTAAGPNGDFLYRFGNPSVFDAGEGLSYNEHEGANEGDAQSFFTHDIHWIPEGLPGAGHLLQFDNGSRHVNGSSYSFVQEINPYDGPMENGVYMPMMEAGFQTIKVSTNRKVSNQVVWFYGAKDPNSFFGRHISGAQRLWNGNTAVCAGTWGNFFEVTPDGEVVWEYKNPVARGEIKTYLKDGDATDTFRTYRYSSDHPALAGKVLVPSRTITGRVPLGGFNEFQPAQTGFGFGGGFGGSGGSGAGSSGGTSSGY